MREEIVPLLEGFSNQLEIEEEVMRTEQGAILAQCHGHGEEMSCPATLEEDVDMDTTQVE